MHLRLRYVLFVLAISTGNSMNANTPQTMRAQPRHPGWSNSDYCQLTVIKVLKD